MVGQQDVKQTLQQRVTSLLRSEHSGYVSGESDIETVDAIYQTLLRAEKDLEAAQERVDRLKWELAKAKTHVS